LFTFRSLKFWKLHLGPCLLPLSVSLLLTADSATPPAAALGRPRPSPTSPPLHVAPPQAPRPTVPSRWSLHPSPRHPDEPRSSSRLPPRRRRGWPSVEPRDSISRAPQLQKRSFIPFSSPSRSFPTQTPRNAAAAPQNAGELTLAVEPRLRSSSARADRLASSAVTSRSS
jgi:hypothetical protein